MGIKKSNVVSINLTDKAICVLQHIGYMNKQKKKKGYGSISAFISNLICDFAEVNRSDWKEHIEMLLIKKEVGLLNKEIDEKRHKLDFLAHRSSIIREKERLIEKQNV